MTLRTAAGDLPAAAFLSDDPDLAGYVVLDFDSFEQWFEEDEAVMGHPRDPRKRIDVRASLRHVVIKVDDVVVADSRRPVLVFETFLPVRYYLPREDVSADFLPGSTQTACACKGLASYFSLRLAGKLYRDLAWTYRNPFDGVRPITDMVAFFDERVDVVIYGHLQPRSSTPWNE